MESGARAGSMAAVRTTAVPARAGTGVRAGGASRDRSPPAGAGRWPWRRRSGTRPAAGRRPGSGRETAGRTGRVRPSRRRPAPPPGPARRSGSAWSVARLRRAQAARGQATRRTGDRVEEEHVQRADLGGLRDDAEAEHLGGIALQLAHDGEPLHVAHHVGGLGHDDDGERLGLLRQRTAALGLEVPELAAGAAPALAVIRRAEGFARLAGLLDARRGAAAGGARAAAWSGLAGDDADAHGQGDGDGGDRRQHAPPARAAGFARPSPAACEVLVQAGPARAVRSA